LKNNDKWDDHLGNLLTTIFNWEAQSIKCSTKLITVLLDIYIGILDFRMINIHELITKGYENRDNYDANKEYREIAKSCNKNIENKSKILAYIEKLLDVNYIFKAFKDQENVISVYEKTLILLNKISDLGKISFKSKWFKNLVDKIEDKFIIVLDNFKDYLEKSEVYTNKKSDYEDTVEGKRFIYYCKVYFINWNFLGYIEQELLKKMLNKKDSPSGKILQFINSVKSHRDFSYLYEKSKGYTKILNDQYGEFQEKINLTNIQNRLYYEKAS
jgi:hypothetical protein